MTVVAKPSDYARNSQWIDNEIHFKNRTDSIDKLIVSADVLRIWRGLTRDADDKFHDIAYAPNVQA